MKKLILTAIVATLTFTPAWAKSQRVSCKSFKTQKEAQAWADTRKKQGKKGWKALDRDQDGVACEWLPKKTRTRTK